MEYFQQPSDLKIMILILWKRKRGWKKWSYFIHSFIHSSNYFNIDHLIHARYSAKHWGIQPYMGQAVPFPHGANSLGGDKKLTSTQIKKYIIINYSMWLSKGCGVGWNDWLHFSALSGSRLAIQHYSPFRPWTLANGVWVVMTYAGIWNMLHSELVLFHFSHSHEIIPWVAWWSQEMDEKWMTAEPPTYEWNKYLLLNITEILCFVVVIT